MGLISRLRGNGNAPTIRELAKDALEIGKEVATDKDKLNELQYKLAMIQAQSMLSGPGQSITKITICFLVSVVVCIGAWVFITDGNIADFKDFALAVVPVIGILTGSYLTGTSIKRKWSKNE